MAERRHNSCHVLDVSSYSLSVGVLLLNHLVHLRHDVPVLSGDNPVLAYKVDVQKAHLSGKHRLSVEKGV